MTSRRTRAPSGLVVGPWHLVALAALVLSLAPPLGAAPWAAIVVDARTGQTFHAENADARLHPASLTKMMTLYLAFEAAEAGRLDLDRPVTVSANAAAEPPSRLGLEPGSRIAPRYLIRAVAVKSANDAATALAEAVAGDEATFVGLMNATAAAIGMEDTTFRNAHGLTAEGQLSTARDMTRLARQLLFDYPDYWNLFSRRTAYAGLREVRHTNARFLGAYAGADGIKTGYTRAAGYNLAASAKRDSVRIFVTAFGAPSSAVRAARVARLMDEGFRRAVPGIAPVPPLPPGARRPFFAPPAQSPPAFADASGPAPAPAAPARAFLADARPLVESGAPLGTPRGPVRAPAAGGVGLTGLVHRATPLF